ncbi:MAG: 16S rRNA (uracil(1498)-N(3))-methyltransferase [Candidatus Binatia bacterium]
MTAHLPRFLHAGPVSVGSVATLSGDEAQHARVRRLARGAAVALFDGAGQSWVGEIVAVGRDRCEVLVRSARPPREAESPLELVLAIGALKADKLDWVVEKATELGVARVQPFSSEFTLARPSAGRQARWAQIALSAAKQCGRSAQPAISPPIEFAALLDVPADARLLLAEHGQATPLVAALSGADSRAVPAGAAPTRDRPRSVLLAVGAEGGFSAVELEAGRAAGFQLVRLGPRILRAETAAVAACALCQALCGDLG